MKTGCYKTYYNYTIIELAIRAKVINAEGGIIQALYVVCSISMLLSGTVFLSIM